jgi:predicted ATP-grasp superfamily ATP-dependent carboligase
MAVVSESLLARPIRQFSVGFARRPGRFLGFVTEKVRPRAHAFGVGSFVSLRDEPTILALGREIAERLDFFGIGEVELLVDGSTGERFVVEVNARPWLQFSMAAASGHDLLHVVTGVRAAGLPRGHSTGLHWWAPMPDVRHLLNDRPEGWTGAARTVVRLGRAAARASIYARFDWRDPAPAWPRKRNP